MYKCKTLLNEDGFATLVKEEKFSYNSKKMDSPTKVAQMLNEVFQLGYQTEEYVYLIAANTQMVPIGVFELSHGTINASLCNPREIFQKLLLSNASVFFLAHNHPSFNVSPSSMDLANYKTIAKAADMMNIELLDSIIVSPNEVYSIREMNQYNCK